MAKKSIKDIMIQNGMSEEKANNILAKIKKGLKKKKPNYPIPKHDNPVYEDSLLDWVNQYGSIETTPIMKYAVFTSEDNMKRMIEAGFDKKCHIYDFSGWLVDDGTIFLIVVYCDDFREQDNQAYRIQFQFSSQSPDVSIYGRTGISSYFADVDAIRLNKFLKEKGLINDDFDFDFETKRSWEEALTLFRNLFN